MVKFDHAAPVLDCCWGVSDSQIFSGGIDQQVKLLNPETKAETVLGKHENAVKSVCWNSELRTSPARPLQHHHLSPIATSRGVDN